MELKASMFDISTCKVRSPAQGRIHVQRSPYCALAHDTALRQKIKLLGREQKVRCCICYLCRLSLTQP
jgi:hypothetical protein